MEQKELVYKYLKDELSLNDKVADLMFNKVSKYEDIYANFLEWLETRDYASLSVLEIEGYTPQKIATEFTHFQAIGVFNLFVDLRDNKERTLKAIKDGFPRK